MLEAITNASEQDVRDRDLGAIYSAQLLVLRNLAKYLDTLKVKEVDLFLIEPHVKEEWNKINTGHTYSIIDSYNIFVGICTYFYELGLNVQKGK